MKKLALTALALVASTGCADQLKPIGDDGGDGATDLMPPHVAEAFGRACGSATCHGGSQTPALDPTSAPGIVDSDSATGIPLVEFGNLQGSYIAIKVLPDAVLDDVSLRVGGIMPVPGNDFDPADISIIIGWIAGTAPPVGDGDDDDGATSDGMDDADTMADESTGTPEPQLCGLEDVAPGVDSPVVMGDEAGVIPTQIGTIINNNCGCHLTTETLVMGAPSASPPPPAGTGTDFATLAGIQANMDTVLARVDTDVNAMPPTYFCDLQDVQALTQADSDALTSWLEMGAPDGATWMGM
ncbi:MAG: hypothetical protein JKY37_25010 [Nannocystaceae bacterium]|nr:hypothetical protein [Nannocystaceae bacterium]